MEQINITILIDNFSKKLDNREEVFFLSKKFSYFFYTICLNYNLKFTRLAEGLHTSVFRCNVFSKNDKNKNFYFDFIRTFESQKRYLLNEKMNRLKKQSNQVSYFKENILLLENEEDCFNFFIKEINDLNLNSKKILLLEKTIFNYEK